MPIETKSLRVNRIQPIASRILVPVTTAQEQTLFSVEFSKRSGQPSFPPLIPYLLRLRGTLSLPQLKDALGAIVFRHAALRSSFSFNPELSAMERNGNLKFFSRTGLVIRDTFLQTVTQKCDVPIEVFDLKRLGAAQQDAELRRLYSAEMKRPFIYSSPPLLRASLISLASNDHLMLIVVDHSVSDRVSMEILAREFQGNYLLQRSPTDVMETPVSFVDFASWQRAYFETPSGARSYRYWGEQWRRWGGSRITPEDFPFFKFTPQPTWKYGAAFEHIEGEDCRKLRAFALQQRITPYLVFLTAYAMVLRAFTGKHEFPIWVHFSNRQRREVHDVIGFFANTHIIGVDLPDNVAFSELLKNVRHAALGAASHQELPLTEFWRASGAAPRMEDPHVILDYEEWGGVPEMPPGDLQFTREALPKVALLRRAAFGVYVVDHHSYLALVCIFSEDMFQAGGVWSFVAALKQVCLEMMADPERKWRDLAALRCIPAAERQGNLRTEMNEFVVIGSHQLPVV